MSSRKKRVQWNVGDVFHIPLLDNDVVLAQLAGREAEVLNSITVALFDVKCKPTEIATAVSFIDAGRAFSVLFTTRDLLDIGVWPVHGPRPISIVNALMPYEHLRQSGWVGARVIGSGVVMDFVNAFYGLASWDRYKDPNYFDGLLLIPSKKPESRLVYKSKKA
jgi:hypothetical protein